MAGPRLGKLSRWSFTVLSDSFWGLWKVLWKGRERVLWGGAPLKQGLTITVAGNCGRRWENLTWRQDEKADPGRLLVTYSRLDRQEGRNRMGSSASSQLPTRYGSYCLACVRVYAHESTRVHACVWDTEIGTEILREITRGSHKR